MQGADSTQLWCRVVSEEQPSVASLTVPHDHVSPHMNEASFLIVLGSLTILYAAGWLVIGKWKKAGGAGRP